MCRDLRSVRPLARLRGSSSGDAPTSSVLLILALLSLVSCAATAPAAPDATAHASAEGLAAESFAPTRVICVRHAEKQGGQDPELTAAGAQRAQALARLLDSADVTHLFASQYRRTAQTLAPLAATTGLEIARYGADDSAALVVELRALPPGSTAVVAGHSNTVPALVRLLGGDLDGTSDSQWGELIDGDAHDRVFVLVLGGDGRATTTLELGYGAD